MGWLAVKERSRFAARIRSYLGLLPSLDRLESGLADLSHRFPRERGDLPSACLSVRLAAAAVGLYRTAR
jgi:hypothetical protein